MGEVTFICLHTSAILRNSLSKGILFVFYEFFFFLLFLWNNYLYENLNILNLNFCPLTEPDLQKQL